MNPRDARIVDALGRVRNLDREHVPELISEFVARGLMSRHRDGSIMFGAVFAGWSPDREIGEAGVCYLSLQGEDWKLLDRVVELLDTHAVNCQPLERYDGSPKEIVLHIKLKPPAPPAG